MSKSHAKPGTSRHHRQDRQHGARAGDGRTKARDGKERAAHGSRNRQAPGKQAAAERRLGPADHRRMAIKPATRELPVQSTPLPKQAQPLPPLQVNGRRTAEWYVIKLPDAVKDAPVGQILRRLPVPPKIADKLLAERGVMKQRDKLSLRLFPEESPEFVAQWSDLNILYEDEFTLVVNKPAGLEIYPSSRGQTGTLANHVAAYYESTGQACRVRHIHRLDKETTGPVIYAKNELAHYIFDRDMREKKIERIYLAVVEGILDKRKGTIDQPIGKDRHHSTRRRVSPTGERAITHYEVVETFRDHTLVRLRLETGRTHQIRVHMSAIGHPLAGDGMYGGMRTWISRQALHGEQLLFNHAWTGKRIAVNAPLPDDMRELLEQLRQHAAR